ncbi:NAD(P)/FAD-dependent oxidoreductase [Lactobacillus acidophilus]|nr:NAD(P)/FAD-dependent oxidoreductase [Lactobacillus acidophilus]MBA4558683.1 NAD(P)/FAD-dependent oxidoreductase [Lactobacillus acidophilus]MBN3461469.1 NAD(P)/FAD-dependent oxidoreductase [Lactobacillus acidophilus]MBN3464578.1 NAD(P)/FAD-dependent oxidoreductase [Lactobacillus acidophilus]MBN3466879.1 NAD(P)/FAD-dependent oxidoreductase [Lactobacillus acidophilus]
MDLAIIGGGPIGLFAAHFAHLHGLNTIVFDSLSEVGGQPQMLYPFKQINDIPAYNSISGTDLIQKLKHDIKNETEIITNHKVVDVTKQSDGFIIDNIIYARSIIIATGAGAFKPKELPLKISDEIKEKIHYFVKDPSQFKNQTIGVFGGGDSALDLALEVAKYANVKLIHRRDQFRGLESNVKKLKSLKNVEILTPYLPKKIELINNQLDISLKKMGVEQLRNVQLDQIVVAYGFRANNRFAKKWGINLEQSNIPVDPTMKTNIDGIYAAGDVVTYPGRVPLIALGFGEAQIAITSIMRNLFPEKSLTIHSTSI